MRVIVTAGLLLSGCSAAGADGGIRRAYHLGLVSVTTPETAGAVSALNVSGLGLGWDDGLYLGWRSASRITADPAKCHLLIVIRSRVETDNAVKVIKSLEGQNPCIVDYTGSLQP